MKDTMIPLVQRKAWCATKIAEHRLRRPARDLLEHLAYKAGSGRVWNHSQEDMAEALKVSRSTVSRGMAVLKAKGLVESQQEHHRGDEYTLAFNPKCYNDDTTTKGLIPDTSSRCSVVVSKCYSHHVILIPSLYQLRRRIPDKKETKEREKQNPAATVSVDVIVDPSPREGGESPLSLGTLTPPDTDGVFVPMDSTQREKLEWAASQENRSVSDFVKMAVGLRASKKDGYKDVFGKGVDADAAPLLKPPDRLRNCTFPYCTALATDTAYQQLEGRLGHQEEVTRSGDLCDKHAHGRSRSTVRQLELKQERDTVEVFKENQRASAPPN